MSLAAFAQEATPSADSATLDETPALEQTAGPQPSYDTIRLFDGSSIQPYHLLVDWVPAFVTTPDHGAWVFFGAQARDTQGFGPRRIYVARFDPEAGIWSPAVAMPGGETQFAPAAAVGPDGAVHVVFSDATSGAGPASTLVYSHSDGKGGWTEPVAIAPDENAGFQMMASLAVDEQGGVHVLWRDQRLATPELRDAHPANGDLFASDLVDGAWSSPQQVLQRPDDTVVAGWPHLAANGDRLVAVWSLYSRTGADTMGNATGVQWASRSLDDPAAWSPAQNIVTASQGDIGGRLIDLTHDQNGNLALVSGEFDKGIDTLRLYRLAAGSDAWQGPTAISNGDFGYMPSAAFDTDNRLVIVFNAGRNRNVEIGAVEISPDSSGIADPVTLSPAEEGLQARATVAISADGDAWVVYMHQPEVNSPATELRVLRGAEFTPGP
ncbi:MAG: hypothetical protein ACR2J8_06510 [Thermomicrobiales bacterium]